MTQGEFAAAKRHRTDAQAFAIRARGGTLGVEGSEWPVWRHRGRDRRRKKAVRRQATRSAILFSGLLKASGLFCFRRNWVGR